MESNSFEAAKRREMVSRTFHLDVKQLEPLQKVSKQLEISQSELVRRSIEFFIDEFVKYNQKNKS